MEEVNSSHLVTLWLETISIALQSYQQNKGKHLNLNSEHSAFNQTSDEQINCRIQNDLNLFFSVLVVPCSKQNVSCSIPFIVIFFFQNIMIKISAPNRDDCKIRNNYEHNPIVEQHKNGWRQKNMLWNKLKPAEFYKTTSNTNVSYS